MKRTAQIIAAIFLSLAAVVQADQSIESAQQILKDQGFYYGDVNGKKDTDTIAAIRRYQIRNGLPITGELDSATQQSLGVGATASARPAVKPTATPEIDTSDLRDNSSNSQATTRVNPTQPRSYDAQPSRGPQDYPFAPSTSRGLPDYPSGGSALPPTGGDVFAQTPYEGASPAVQRQVIVGAQVILMRGGYYRSGVDGIYGPGMEFSLRAYQSRIGLPPSGRLDMETLSALRLLPGQRAMEFGPPRRMWAQPPVRGEWIH
ncbi:MAG: hypothetical protein QOI04_1393 [Verrucomicrobiota bacterium]|jgi:peptidoglycan hydrolase-like protein with peptidoglycan-binding domain